MHLSTPHSNTKLKIIHGKEITLNQGSALKRRRGLSSSEYHLKKHRYMKGLLRDRKETRWDNRQNGML